eukprot:g62005.t1
MESCESGMCTESYSEELDEEDGELLQGTAFVKVPYRKRGGFESDIFGWGWECNWSVILAAAGDWLGVYLKPHRPRLTILGRARTVWAEFGIILVHPGGKENSIPRHESRHEFAVDDRGWDEFVRLSRLDEFVFPDGHLHFRVCVKLLDEELASVTLLPKSASRETSASTALSHPATVAEGCLLPLTPHKDNETKRRQQTLRVDSVFRCPRTPTSSRFSRESDIYGQSSPVLTRMMEESSSSGGESSSESAHSSPIKKRTSPGLLAQQEFQEALQTMSILRQAIQEAKADGDKQLEALLTRQKQEWQANLQILHERASALISAARMPLAQSSLSS